MALGIDDYVNQVIQNWQDIQNTKWSGSAQSVTFDEWRYSGTKSFTISQKESSDNIVLQSAQIYVAKAGTYRFSGGISTSYVQFCSTGGATVYIELTTGQRIGTVGIRTGSTNSTDMLSTVTFSGATSFGIRASINANSYFGFSSSSGRISIANLQINRIS